MARADQSAHPIQTLRDTAQSLEASILLCLAKPTQKAVHRMRTATRRIEAQLELLATFPDLPPHEKHQRKSRRLLKQLRRAAGRVRDLDVHRDLIRDEAAAHKGAPSTVREVKKQAGHLRRDLKRQRDKGAAILLKLLRRHRTEIPLIIKKLLDALAPAKTLSLTESALTTLVREWYAAGPTQAIAAQPDEFHTIRKRAKIARYLAESAPKSAAKAHRLAAKFETLQQAGGEWHDWLLLAQLSTKEFGESAALPRRFTAKADRSLRAFKHRLSYKI